MSIKWSIPSLMAARTFALDYDAQAFINATGITDTTIIMAINTLVVSAKSNGWWTKCVAIYPVVGGTSTTCKYNLKDPRDLDAAYRLSFTGSWTIDSNGIQGNGTDTYADTFLIPSSVLTSDDTHISIYSRTNTAQQSYDMGSTSGAGTRLSFHSRWSTNAFFGDQYSSLSGRTTYSNLDSLGHYLDTRTSSTNHVAYKNGSAQNTNSTSIAASMPGVSIYIGNANGDLVGRYSTRQYAFCTIGSSVDSTIASLMYTDIQVFQTSLGRQV